MDREECKDGMEPLASPQWKPRGAGPAKKPKGPRFDKQEGADVFRLTMPQFHNTGSTWRKRNSNPSQHGTESSLTKERPQEDLGMTRKGPARSLRSCLFLGDSSFPNDVSNYYLKITLMLPGYGVTVKSRELFPAIMEVEATGS